MVTVNSEARIFDRRAIPKNATESIWLAEDGWEIRRIDWKRTANTRGSILFLPGRGDHYEKYLETLDYFAHANWNVTGIDWRGQGGSGRFLDDHSTGHIDDFATWVADLRQFYAQWSAEQDGPIIIMAHSMGGHLVMRAAIEKIIDPDAIVLIAPMLSIKSGGLPLWLTRAFAGLMVKLGRGEKQAWKTSEKPLSPATLRAKMLTHDQERYSDELAWWALRPEVKLGPASWQWVERAAASVQKIHEPGTLESVDVPILILATTADQLVSTDQIIADTERLPNVQLLLFGAEASHELLRETDIVRNKCLAVIDEFLDRYAAAK
jgi:lysophospholipase